MKKLILSGILYYQRVLSLDQGYLGKVFRVGKICRFTPTCSEYMYRAVDRYGIIYGLWLGAKRIVRCNPLNAGGYDPVP